jgi:hypothetical protein
MNPEVKAKWLQALRSGEYKQCEGKLKSQYEDGTCAYCCLGVLSDIHAKETEQGDWVDGAIYRDSTGDTEMGVLTKGVRVWAGLSKSNPDARSSSVAELNDGGVSFAHLADIIEEQF